MTFVESIAVNGKEYFQKYKSHDSKARLDYQELKKEYNPEEGKCIGYNPLKMGKQ